MLKSKQYPLDFEKALEYVRGALDKVNSFSSIVLSTVKFQEGNFYSFLKPDIEKGEEHKFKKMHLGGGVYPSTVSLIHDYLTKVKRGVFISDDYNQDYVEDGDWPLMKDYGVHQGKELYYMMGADQSNLEDIYEALRYSDTTWHSLGIVSDEIMEKPQDNILTPEMMMKVAVKAKFIIITAYDGESFVIWERNN